MPRAHPASLVLVWSAACGGGDGPVTNETCDVHAVSVTPETAQLTLQETVALSATVAQAGCSPTPAVQWRSNNPSVATVSPGGVVTGITVGATWITATASQQADSAMITVHQAPVDAVDVSIHSGIIMISQTTKAVASPRDSRGRVLSGRAIEWSSSDPRVATVDAVGLITGVAAGSRVTIRASSEGVTGTTDVLVTPKSWDGYALQFPHADSVGTLVVRSDVSDAFTRDHLEFLRKTWNYYHSLTGVTPGSGTRILWTTDSARYVLYPRLCPYLSGDAQWSPLTRQVGACWYTPDEGRWTWVLVPYKQPDYGTILHEIGHTFSQAAYYGQEQHPWFKEGTGMYWEGAEEAGGFDASGKLMHVMHSWVKSWFRHYDRAGQLVRLGTLLTLSTEAFYGGPYGREYSQAGAFVYYLAETFPTLLPAMFRDMRQGIITTNDQLLAYIQQATGKTMLELENGYLALTRSLIP